MTEVWSQSVCRYHINRDILEKKEKKDAMVHYVRAEVSQFQIMMKQDTWFFI